MNGWVCPFSSGHLLQLSLSLWGASECPPSSPYTQWPLAKVTPMGSLLCGSPFESPRFWVKEGQEFLRVRPSPNLPLLTALQHAPLVPCMPSEPALRASWAPSSAVACRGLPWPAWLAPPRRFIFSGGPCLVSHGHSDCGSLQGSVTCSGLSLPDVTCCLPRQTAHQGRALPCRPPMWADCQVGSGLRSPETPGRRTVVVGAVASQDPEATRQG